MTECMYMYMGLFVQDGYFGNIHPGQMDPYVYVYVHACMHVCNV